MKRFIIFALAAMLLLAACSPALPAIEEPEPTTVPWEFQTVPRTTTTQATTTTEVIERPESWTGREVVISDTITVFEQSNSHELRPGQWVIFYEIWMHNEVTGEETILLETRNTYYVEDLFVPLSFSINAEVNERFFAFSSGVPGTCAWGGVSFYDIGQQRAVSIVPCPKGRRFFFDRVENNRIYLREELNYEILGWVYIEISALESGDPVIVNEVQP